LLFDHPSKAEKLPSISLHVYVSEIAPGMPSGTDMCWSMLTTEIQLKINHFLLGTHAAIVGYKKRTATDVIEKPGADS
jgi:hypothetical protein